LAKDLARTKLSENWMVWREVTLGSFSVPRADVFAVAKSFANPRFIIYEIKTSRSDFLHDVNTGKYRGYFSCCSQFYFACPSGVLGKGDVPEHCGLIVRNENGWHTVKSATRREFKPSQDLWIRLLIKGYEDHFERYRQEEGDRFKEYKSLKEASWLYGGKVAKDIASGQDIIAQAKQLTEDAGKALGRDFPTLENAIWSLQAEVHKLIDRRKYVIEAIELADLTIHLFQGTYFFGRDVPKKLRDIAERLDKQFTKEEQVVK